MTAELPPHIEPTYHDAPRDGSSHNVALIALVAFIFGVALNGYVALSILDDGGGGDAGSSGDDSPIIVPADPVVTPTASPTPLPDRSDCEEIRGTDYRSATEREFFLQNCINQPEPSPTLDPTQLPPLDGGTSTDEDAEGNGEDAETTPTPEP